MAGHTILLNLFGGVALLLWGTHMVQSAHPARLRHPIAPPSPAPPPARCAPPPPVPPPPPALQSATAIAMLLSSFVARGLIALAGGARA